MIVFVTAFMLTFHCDAENKKMQGLCKAEETAIFSCTLENEKAVGICSASEDGLHFIEYRYGTGLKSELRFRANPHDERKKFHRAEVLYASNAAEMIWFGNKNVFYRIHMLVRGGPFLDVVQDGKIIAHHNCKHGWRNVESHPVAGNKSFVDHGSGYDSDFSQYWVGR